MSVPASRALALAVVGGAVLIANYDPVVTALPDLPASGGVPVTESAKQAFVLALTLVTFAALAAAWGIWRPSAVAVVDAQRVFWPTGIVAVGGFLVLYAGSSDDRGALAVATLLVLVVGTLAALQTLPAVPAGSISRLPLVATVGAVVLIAGYGAILWLMLSRAGTPNQTEWERLVTLFAGVESIAFAAVGALLGQQVQKAQTTAEADRADENGEIVKEAKALGGRIEAALGVTPDEGDAPAQRSAAARLLAEQLRNLPDPR